MERAAAQDVPRSKIWRDSSRWRPPNSARGVRYVAALPKESAVAAALCRRTSKAWRKFDICLSFCVILVAGIDPRIIHRGGGNGFYRNLKQSFMERTQRVRSLPVGKPALRTADFPVGAFGTAPVGKPAVHFGSRHDSMAAKFGSWNSSILDLRLGSLGLTIGDTFRTFAPRADPTS